MCAASTSMAAAADFNLRMTSFMGDTSQYFTCLVKPFAERVASLSGGRVEITTYGAGVLHPASGGYDAVGDGLADLTHTHPVFLGSSDPANVVRAVINPGADAALFMALDPGIVDAWAQHRRDTLGLHSIPLGVTPTEFFGHSHIPIRNGADLQGVKMRMLGEWAKVFQEKYGATPVAVPGSEIFGMLEKKAIDMSEYASPAQNVQLGFNEIAKYIIYPGLHARSAVLELAINGDVWDSFPEDIQGIFNVAAKLTTVDCLGELLAADMDAIKAVKERGANEFIKLDAEFQKEAEAALVDLVRSQVEAAEANGNEWARRIFDAQMAFIDRWKENSNYLSYDH